MYIHIYVYKYYFATKNKNFVNAKTQQRAENTNTK